MMCGTCVKSQHTCRVRHLGCWRRQPCLSQVQNRYCGAEFVTLVGKAAPNPSLLLSRMESMELKEPLWTRSEACRLVLSFSETRTGVSIQSFMLKVGSCSEGEVRASNKLEASSTRGHDGGGGEGHVEGERAVSGHGRGGSDGDG